MIALEEKLGKVGEAILVWMTTDWAIGEGKSKDGVLTNMAMNWTTGKLEKPKFKLRKIIHFVWGTTLSNFGKYI